MQMQQFISDKLKECREASGLSIDLLMIELSGLGLVVHSNTLRNWEEGRSEPDVSDLAVIASFYKKPIQYFFAKNTNHSG